MTWSKEVVPPRFGYFVEGQSNAVGRPRRETPRRAVGDPTECLAGAAVGRPVGDIDTHKNITSEYFSHFF